jgi:hypothetical protein
MRDRVWYAPPLGAVGRIAHRLFIAQQLRDIFAFRAAAIARRFGASASLSADAVAERVTRRVLARSAAAR